MPNYEPGSARDFRIKNRIGMRETRTAIQKRLAELEEQIRGARQVDAWICRYCREPFIVEEPTPVPMNPWMGASAEAQREMDKHAKKVHGCRPGSEDATLCFEVL